MSLNNSRQDVSEEDTANTWTGQRFLWLLRGDGVGEGTCSLHFTILCSQLQTVYTTGTGSFPFEKTTMAVWMCASVSVRVFVCVCVCFLAKTNSDDKSGTFKKTLILDPFTQTQTWA